MLANIYFIECQKLQASGDVAVRAAEMQSSLSTAPNNRMKKTLPSVKVIYSV